MSKTEAILKIKNILNAHFNQSPVRIEFPNAIFCTKICGIEIWSNTSITSALFLENKDDILFIKAPKENIK